ncbi:MAG: PqqD family peptide modification chaperone [Pseudomonadota bacterium]
MITADTVVRRGNKHVETEVADQTMMMNIDKGKYYALEGTAKLIWGELENPMRVGDLVSKMVDTYEVETDQCMTDVLGFLSDLVENGLVVAETP